jgi:hypothetical protein
VLDAGAFHDEESDSHTFPGRSSTAHNTQHRLCLVAQLEQLLLCIREQPGFRNFMLPLPFAQLCCAAACGPIIILNVSSHCCDALIVTLDSPPQLVPLPDMSLDQVSDLAANVRKHQNSLAHTPQAFRSCLKEILHEIWRTAVLPVLKALGYTDSQDKSTSKPRVWWCPTRPLSFIPIHAAGPYTKSGGPNLLHIVVSSYTNTLSALLQARSQCLSVESCQIVTIK